MSLRETINLKPHNRFLSWTPMCVMVSLMVSGCLQSLLADVPAAVKNAEQQRIEAIAKASKSAIAVFAATGEGGGGSGVVITPDGYALTNYHVVQPCGVHMKCSMNDGNLYDAVLVSIDAVGDVALIKLLGRDDFPTADMADSDQVQTGDFCFAVGNPFLLATDFQPTVTYGIVSGVHRYQYPAGTLLEYADCIQTDASINPGNSGGPLFNAQAQLIGINGRGSFEKRGRVNVGVGYAISINQIKNFMGHLHSGRILDHATLGATVATDEDGNVVVANILDSSDAYRRGLRYNDQIVSFGGRAIGTVNGFKNALGIFPKGWRVPLSYRRNGQRFDIFVRLEGLHAEEELLAKLEGPARQTRRRRPNDQTPKDDGPGKKPGDDQPKKENPQDGNRVNPHAKKTKLPEKIASLYKKKRGYSNYYFNKLHRERIWQGFVERTNLNSSTLGVLKLDGKLKSGEVVKIELADERCDAVWKDLALSVDYESELNQQLAPTDSGGLLLALSSWFRMLQVGPAQFGDVFYLGDVPAVGFEKPPHVLIGTFDVLESRFYFDQDSGLLVLLELYPETDVDPCEVYFEDYVERDGQFWPQRIRVVNGNDEFETIEIESVKVDSSAAGEKS